MNLTSIDVFAYRNIPSFSPQKISVNADINTVDEQEKLTDLINASYAQPLHGDRLRFAESWPYTKGDDEKIEEFLFSKTEVPPTRFGDGSFPLWYGSEDVETSFNEIEFHLKNDVVAMNGQDFVEFRRVLFHASLKLKKNLDITNLSKELLNYKSTDSYPECQKMVKSYIAQGASSFTYLSARSSTQKKCYAVTNKEEVISSTVKGFYVFKVYKSSNATEITELDFVEELIR